MNATTTVERPRTLAQAQDRIDELLAAGDPVQLKATITSLTNQLAARDAEIKASQQSSAPGAAAPAAPVTSQPPAAKSLDDMSLSELARAADECGLAGDHAKANLYYQAYSRKQAGR